MGFDDDIKGIKGLLKTVLFEWDGKEAIVEMKDNGFPHWRQMEWIGWYFQYLCENRLGEKLQIPGPKYGRSEFDGLGSIPWDFKSHTINTKSKKIIVNDTEATAHAIEEYGEVGLVLAKGEAIYNDDDGSFKTWHDELKGKITDYEKKRIKRGAPSRSRKTSFKVKEIQLIRLNDDTLINSGSFQEGFRNSNGLPRREKVMLDLKGDWYTVGETISFSE
jgi:hypothetical protein